MGTHTRSSPLSLGGSTISLSDDHAHTPDPIFLPLFSLLYFLHCWIIATWSSGIRSYVDCSDVRYLLTSQVTSSSHHLLPPKTSSHTEQHIAHIGSRSIYIAQINISEQITMNMWPNFHDGKKRFLEYWRHISADGIASPDTMTPWSPIVTTLHHLHISTIS